MKKIKKKKKNNKKNKKRPNKYDKYEIQIKSVSYKFNKYEISP